MTVATFLGKTCKRGHSERYGEGDGRCYVCMRETNKAWAEANAIKMRGYKADWRDRNPEQSRACTANWAKTNPLKKNAKEARRRSVKKGAAGNHTAADVTRLKEWQNGRCAYCRVRLDKVTMHVDHVLPLSAGGDNSPQNLQLLCQQCNLLKGTKHPLVFARQLGRLI